MGKAETRLKSKSGKPAVKEAARVPAVGEPPGWRRMAVKMGRALGLLLALVWGLLCLRAGQHHRAGVAAEAAGRRAEAAREYETAIGFCAPFNPYCGASAERMLALAARAEAGDPLLAEEVRDRLRRSLRATRGLAQPHAELLRAAHAGAAATPRDPRGGLFLLSWGALLVGFGAWWAPRPLGFRAAVGFSGLAAWAFLLYLS